MIKSSVNKIDLFKTDKEIYEFQRRGLYPSEGETYRLIDDKGNFRISTVIGFGLEYCNQIPLIYFSIYESFENIDEFSLIHQDLESNISILMTQWKELDKEFTKLNPPKVNSYFLHIGSNGIYKIDGYAVGFETNLNGNPRDKSKLEIKIKYSKHYRKDEKQEGELKCLKVFERPLLLFTNDYDNINNCKKFQQCNSEGKLL